MCLIGCIHHAGGLAGLAAEGTAGVPHSVRVKIVTPVLPRGIQGQRQVPHRQQVMKDGEVKIQPVGSPLQLPYLSPMADWVKAGGQAEALPEASELVQMADLARNLDSDPDLGAFFRAQQQDTETPEFGLMVSDLRCRPLLTQGWPCRDVILCHSDTT